MSHTERVVDLLSSVGLTGPWQIEAPDKGVTGRTAIARRNSRHEPSTVVVKFTPAPPSHQRLHALGVGCEVVASGWFDDQPFHVQSFLDGTARSWGWMGEHLDRVIALVARYAADPELTDELRPGSSSDLARHRREIWDETLGWLGRADDPSLLTVELTRAATLVEAGVAADNDAALVPSHTDVNNTNVIELADPAAGVGGLAMVDWDGLCLSDPARDLGTMIWWYRPADSTGPGFDQAWDALGLPKAAWSAATRRAHWWAAVTSLRAALWNDQHGSDAGVIASFAEDFVAAAHGRGNPKQQGSTLPVLS